MHDKLYLPGLVKLRRLVDEGFFGRILSLRGEFGYWVFEGDGQAAQRPQLELPQGGRRRHRPSTCSATGTTCSRASSARSRPSTRRPRRTSRPAGTSRARPTTATADDAAYGIFEIETPGGDPVVAQINSSWAVRVYRDELVEFQIDGTHGSAVAGLNKCVAQQRAHTPKPVWNPDLPVTESFRDQWLEVPANGDLDNGFKLQWEEFLRDVVAGRDRTASTCCRPPAACSSPSWACSRRRRAAASTSRTACDAS